MINHVLNITAAVIEINGSCKAKFPIISCKSQLEFAFSTASFMHLLCWAHDRVLILHVKRALQQAVNFMMWWNKLELKRKLFVITKHSHFGGSAGTIGSKEKERKSSEVFNHLQNMQSSRVGLERGNNLGVALLTLITQMFKALGCISSETELLQQHSVFSAVLVRWSQ